MANVNFNKKIFEKEIGKIDSEMENKISMFGTPVESIKDEEIELEIFPNRPDLLSYQGFKRSFLSFLGKKTGLKNYTLRKPEKNYEVKIDSSVSSVRPYTVCAIVRGLKLDDNKIKEIIDLQEKLHNTLGRRRKKAAIGIYPLEEIELPITFKALEPEKIRFVPLNSPLNREMSGLEILQRHPTGKDYAHLLAGKTKFPIFIDAKDQVLSMPPIINSQITGKISTKTRDIFIECSGSNFEILKKCLNIIITSLAEIGGKVYQMELKYSGKFGKEITPNLTPEKRKLSTTNAEKLLGIKLKEKEIKNYLEKMGHNYNPKTKEVEIPSWRTDILHEVDLIEEIAIAHGYDNFQPEIPEIATIGKEDKKETIKRKISDILTGLGFLEVSNYHLTSKNEQFVKMGIPKSSIEKKEQFIEVEESKTNYNILRKNLSHYLLKNISENIDAEYPQKIFETGKVFELKNQIEIKEKEKLAFSVTPGNFTEIKQILQYLGEMLGLKFDVKEKEKNPDYLIDGRAGKILFEDKEIGTIGEVHPRILKNWKIKMPVSLIEIYLEEILEKLQTN
ncbi:phenylalanine--tRNA ligase subunit beta [Candidatus Pacearchaeota archaeon]|nr:phenylalanine--tRNA ligase subunit beta [Candidatus Pacearchaeota archaeon]